MREGLDAPVGSYPPDGDWQFNHDLVVSELELSTGLIAIRCDFGEE
jgi:hypothetical protein